MEELAWQKNASAVLGPVSTLIADDDSSFFLYVVTLAFRRPIDRLWPSLWFGLCDLESFQIR